MQSQQIQWAKELADVFNQSAELLNAIAEFNKHPDFEKSLQIAFDACLEVIDDLVSPDRAIDEPETKPASTEAERAIFELEKILRASANPDSKKHFYRIVTSLNDLVYKVKLLEDLRQEQEPPIPQGR